MVRLCSLLLFAFLTVLFSGEAPLAATEREAILAGYRNQLAVLDRAIAESPQQVSLFSQRGDRRLFLGQFAGAVADFEKMIALDPAQDAPHWRLGIAYYFAAQFAKSARQFEKYHAYDGGDRENGLWKFLGDCKTMDRAAAQKAMLVYTRFDREPFPALYELFAGRRTTAEFFTDLTARKLKDDPRVMFFAHYYAGLHEELLGHRTQALELLHAAVANRWGQTAENGPAYMWQVARLHFETLAAATP